MVGKRKPESLSNPKMAKHSQVRSSRQIFIRNKAPFFSLRVTFSYFEHLLTCLILLFACLDAVLSHSGIEEPFPKEKCELALPECRCEEGYMDVAVLTCQNVSNFDKFSQTLSDGSVFKVNTTLEINLSGVRELPRGFLKELILQRFYADDIQMEVIDQRAFEGILLLKKFYVQLSSVQEIPDFRAVRNSLRNLNLDNSRITSISGDHLKNLPNLETVSFVNNSIQAVASDAFQGTNNLIIFDLSYNKLKTLPQDLFDSWKKLNKVVLTSNQLLNVDHLFKVVNPSFIYLDHNSLMDLDSILYPNMHKLQTLLLSYNPFQDVTNNSFNGNVDNLRSLFMDHCNLSEFNPKHFQQLHSLSALDLSYNRIENVTNQTIQFGIGLELNLAGNKIKEFNANLAYRVAHLNLDKNLLTSISRSLQNSQILDVNMAENRIETLGPEDFRGVFGIQTIDLQGNLIYQVDSLTFQGIRRDLVHLDLSRNQIRSLQGCVRDLHLLTSLNLTGNRIEFFEEGDLQGMVELLELYLDGNFITTLGDEMQHLDQLQLLSVANNRISNLKPEQVPRTVKYLYYEGNPFKCDCQMLPFLQHLNFSTVTTDIPLCSPSNQTTLLPPTSCPDGCHCFCSRDKDSHFMTVDCSSSGLIKLPHPFNSEASSTTKENCSTMAIYLPRDTRFSQNDPFVIEDQIGGLNLTHNSLQALDGASFPHGMRQLFLGDNHLEMLPLHLFYSLVNLNKVSLSGNPWSCNCDLQLFKEWILYKSEIIIDGNETRCGPQAPGLAGRLIWSLSDSDLCPAETGSSTSLIIGLLCFFLVIAVTAIALVAFWPQAKIWLIAHGVTFFVKDGSDQITEFENLHLLQAREKFSRNNFPLPNDQQDHSRNGSELERDGNCMFQELAVVHPTDEYVSLTHHSKLPV